MMQSAQTPRGEEEEGVVLRMSGADEQDTEGELDGEGGSAAGWTCLGFRIHSPIEPLMQLLTVAGACSLLVSLINFTMWGFFASAGLCGGAAFSSFQVRQLAIQQKIAAAVTIYKMENAYYEEENAKLLAANEEYISLNEEARQKNEQLADSVAHMKTVADQLQRLQEDQETSSKQLQVTRENLQALDKDFEEQGKEFNGKVTQMREQNDKAKATLQLVAAGVDNLDAAEKKQREVWGQQLGIIRRELLNNYFQAIDKDRSGYLDKAELKGAHDLIALGFNPNRVDLDDFDVSRDGKISRSEFVAHAQHILGPEQVMHKYQEEINELKAQCKEKGIALPPRKPEYVKLKRSHGWQLDHSDE